MAINCYKNSLADQNVENPAERERTDSGLTVKLVVASFAMLCFIQVVLNISLRLSYSLYVTEQHLDVNSSSLACQTGELVQQRDERRREKVDLLHKYRDCISQLNSKDKVEHEHCVDLVQKRDNLQATVVEQHREIQSLKEERDTLKARIVKLEGRTSKCPSGWISRLSSCYLLSSERLQWYKAREDCVNRGAHLMIINSQEEQMILRTMGGFIGNVWIGLSLKAGGVWTWEDGTTLNSAYWDFLQPNFQFLEQAADCVTYKQGKVVLSTWHNAPCEQSQRWVCEKELN